MFFLRDESGGVHVENGEGLFFMSPGDAKDKLQELKGVEGTKVEMKMNLGRVPLTLFSIASRPLRSVAAVSEDQRVE